MTDPSDLKYTADHEWVDVAGDIATIGITSYAADQLGDVVYVQLPSVGDMVTAGAVVGEIESTKSVGELFAPMSGEVTEVNDDVATTPELVNSDPFAAWLIRVRFDQLPGLLTADEYAKQVSDS
jgi:glycine cleavage system H protein